MNDFELMYFDPQDRTILNKVSKQDHVFSTEEILYLSSRNLLIKLKEGYYLVKNPREYHVLTELYPVLTEVTIREVSEVLSCLYNGYIWDYNYVRLVKKDPSSRK